MAESTVRGVLYHVVCAAPRARYASELVSRAQDEGWTVRVIATPSALAFIDAPALEQRTGLPVRSDYAPPGSKEVLLPADAMVVCPATFNTISKWAHGHADNLALSLLTEAIGRGLPLVAAPALNDAQAAHPAFARSIADLREMGVSVLYGSDVYEPAPPGTGGRPYDWGLPLRTLDEVIRRSVQERQGTCQRRQPY